MLAGENDFSYDEKNVKKKDLFITFGKGGITRFYGKLGGVKEWITKKKKKLKGTRLGRKGEGRFEGKGSKLVRRGYISKFVQIGGGRKRGKGANLVFVLKKMSQTIQIGKTRKGKSLSARKKKERRAFSTGSSEDQKHRRRTGTLATEHN